MLSFAGGSVYYLAHNEYIVSDLQRDVSEGFLSVLFSEIEA